MLVNQPAILPGAFAAEGDKNTIPANNDGLSGLASIAKGFPHITQVPLAQGGQPPQRQDFNGIFNLFSQFLLYAQNGGVYAYNNTLDYQPPCIISYDGEFYSCKQENGPSTSAGVQAPTIATYWEKVIVNSALEAILSAYAKLNSPTFTGVPTVPTADAGTNTTQIASTAFVKNALSGIDLSKYALKSDLDTKANINSPVLTGTPTSTTPASSDNSTRIATTAFVKALVGAANNGGIVSANLAQNGYVKFANGFILQWGMYFMNSGGGNRTQVFNFPLAFPASCNSILVNEFSQYGTSEWINSIAVYAKTKSSFTVINGQTQSCNVHMIAAGS